MGLFKDCGCGCDGKKQEQKLMNSILAALVFFIIASPDTFRLMRKIFGKWVSGPNGCPTSGGLALHSIVFMFITWGLMNIKSEGYTAESGVIGPSPEEVVDQFPEETGDEELELQVSDEAIDLEESDLDLDLDTSVSMKPAAPTRMADAPLPLPDMAEEKIGAFDSGAMYAPMDLGVDGDKPQPMIGGIAASLNTGLSVTCADGSRPIVA
jgi:hypothetical protein